MGEGIGEAIGGAGEAEGGLGGGLAGGLLDGEVGEVGGGTVGGGVHGGDVVGEVDEAIFGKFDEEEASGTGFDDATEFGHTEFDFGIDEGGGKVFGRDSVEVWFGEEEHHAGRDLVVVVADIEAGAGAEGGDAAWGLVG